MLATVGFLLSPLSFWNDLFVNIPLAYLFAMPFGYLSPAYFFPAMVAGYWLTNVAGFALMHKGAVDMTSKEKKAYSRRDLAKDFLMSLAYTVLVALLVHFEVLRLPTEYFS